jgi:prolyl 4-hydroxylase
VISGTKWTATKWIHARPFRWVAPPPPAAPPGCDNKHETCKAWANAGECAKNPGFMLEDCRWACKACPGMANEQAYLDLKAAAASS